MCTFKKRVIKLSETTLDLALFQSTWQANGMVQFQGIKSIGDYVPAKVLEDPNITYLCLEFCQLSLRKSILVLSLSRNEMALSQSTMK